MRTIPLNVSRLGALLLIIGMNLSTISAQDPTDKPAQVDGEIQDNVLEALQEKMIAAIGVQSTLEKIKNRRMISTVSIVDAGIEAKNFGFISADGVMSESLSIEGYGDFRQGVHGGVVWSADPINGPAIISGAMRDQLLRSAHLFPPLQFHEDFASIILSGEESIDDEDCNVYLFKTKTGTEEKYWVSKANHRTIQVSLIADSPMGKIPMKVQMKNYKSVDEIWYPHTMNIEQGIQKMTLEVGQILHNVEPEETELTAPKSVLALIERKKEGAKPPEAEKGETKEPVAEPEKQKETDR